MCSPMTFDCYPFHYALLVNSAMERFNDKEVNLSPHALKALVDYGNVNKAAFDAALRPEDQDVLDDLSAGLHHRLDLALKASPQTDEQGRSFYPARIDADAVRRTLADRPWLP